MKTEEKAEAYDRAIEGIQEILSSGQDSIKMSRLRLRLQGIFPELAESDDEKIRKEILDYIDKATGCERWVAWLEKQGEKPQGKSALEAIKEEKVDNQNCVKPTDKVEPKFKVGDWIVSKTSNLVYRVDSILFPQSKCYCLSCNGGTVLLNFDDEQNYHLWTIKDAKEGDVLANDNHILILKELDYDWYTNGTPYSVHAYCGIKSNGNFEMGKDNWCFCGTSHIHPATKEERDLLFAKMKEEGYEWDEEKKELKIDFSKHLKRNPDVPSIFEQNPTWSEDEEDAISQAIMALEDMFDEDNPKNGYTGYKLSFIDAADRLKSLKGRIYWKPSEEHIHWLKWTINRMPDTEKANEAEAVLKDLLEQLEKL